MFHFPRFASAAYLIQLRMQRYEPLRIAPFGNPRIKGRLRLPTDYRGLPRPSSPVAAKASVMRPNSLPANNSNWLPCLSRRGGASAAPHCSARPPRGERAALTRGALAGAAFSLYQSNRMIYSFTFNIVRIAKELGFLRTLGSAMRMRRRLVENPQASFERR